MKKKIRTSLLILTLIISQLLPVTVSAKTPPVMASLRSYIQTYGALRKKTYYGTETYTSSISYQKKKKRFLLQYNYSNGRSTATVKMYMPVSKKKAKYTVYFNQTIRASGLTARTSGKAKLKRKTYNDQSTTLKFSRKNKTSVSKRITNSVYQSTANSLLRYAFKLWESELETGPTLCFRNFGFNHVTVIDGSLYTNEW